MYTVSQSACVGKYIDSL